MALETPDRIHAVAACRTTLTELNFPAAPNVFEPSFDSSNGFNLIEQPDPTNLTIVRFGLNSPVGVNEAVPFIQGVPDAESPLRIRMGPPDIPTGEPLQDLTPVDQLLAQVSAPVQFAADTEGQFFRFFVFLFCLFPNPDGGGPDPIPSP